MKWSEIKSQCAIWFISTKIILILFPWIVLLWIWNAVVNFSGTQNRTRHRPDPSKLAFIYGGTSRFVQLKEVKIHYVEAGDRNLPLMLCLHGFPEFWYSWRNQLKEFSSTHWVVAMDMRGYGESDKPKGRHAYLREKLVEDVRQVIQKLERKECILLAHDWGGAVGWQFVSKYPEMVTKFIPMNCPHSAVFYKTLRSNLGQISKSWYMYFFQLPLIPEILLTAFGGSFFYYWIHRGREAVIGEENVQVYMDLYRRPEDLTGPINYYRNMMETLLPNFLLPHRTHQAKPMQIRVPTMLVWGRNDKALSASMAFLSANWIIADFSVKMIDDASHWVQQDKPTLVNQYIRHFLAE